jgi:hypothetical protein
LPKFQDIPIIDIQPRRIKPQFINRWRSSDPTLRTLRTVDTSRLPN